MTLLYIVCCDWIWNDLNHQGGAGRKLATTMVLGLGFPIVWLWWITRVIRVRVRQGPARRGHEREPALRLAA
jgi:hypothetical protein